MAFKASDFLAQQLAKQRELGQMQRYYKSMLTKKLLTRAQGLNQKGCAKTRERMRADRDDLRAKVWVANSASNKRINNEALENIQCQVECQEHLSEDIRNLKVGIKNLEREIGRTNKQWLLLNRQTVPASQHMAYVKKARKMLEMLQSGMEVAERRECTVWANNARLREQIVLEINHRGTFNDLYTKSVQRLQSDKKYLTELIEHAIGSFENGIHAYDKTEAYKSKHDKETEQHKNQVKHLMRKLAHNGNNQAFLQCKEKERELADLQPKEYRRREEFRRRHLKQIKIYKDVIGKIKAYTKSPDIASVIEKFKDQESLYYSYFNYANELGYHVTLLGNSVARLYSEIQQLKKDNNNTLDGQLTTISNLEDILHEKRRKNAALKRKCDNNDIVVENMLENIGDIFEISGADGSSLMEYLGDNTSVNLGNARNVLKLLEQRLLDVIAAIYVGERHDDVPGEFYVVQDIAKEKELPTRIEEIVLAQQCPECAEGEATNMYDGGSDEFSARSPREIRKKLYEKITQPEMQYRLHSISQCRLPRSRLLAAKRNV